MFSINELRLIIDNGINDLYKNLILTDLNIIKTYTSKLIEIIAYQYNVSTEEMYEQLNQENYRDIKWLSSLLLPYINVPRDELRSFKQMYIEKIKEVDINKEEPQYKFTNIQYSRCFNKKNDEEIISSEIEFSEKYLEQNFLLLVKSIIQSSHKLYVNWINILPIPSSDIAESDLFNNTLNLILQQNYYDIVDDLEYMITKNINDIQRIHLNSLYIGDIYNCLRNYYYDEIKKIKLLIFDLYVKSDNKLLAGLYVLHDYFTYSNFGIDVLQKALINDKWINLSDNDRNFFTKKWKDLIKIFLNKEDLNIINDETQYKIDTVSVSNLIKAVLISFEYNYRDKKNLKESKYINIKTNIKLENTEELTELDEEKILTFEIFNAKQVLDSIKPEFIYDFFRDILQQFKITIYCKNYLSDDKNNILSSLMTDENDDFTLKNLYNFAKSFSHISSGFKLLDKNWESLSSENKKIIINRINKIGDNKWFDISKILRQQQNLGLLPPGKNVIKNKNKQIYDNIHNILIFSICDTLIKKGVLSKFKPFILTKEIKIFDILKSSILNTYENNKYFSETYYYLTEQRYSEKYFETISSNDWYSMDAMYWISQLGFVHHYINNRVSFISGATGVGKSTHVPKLFLYNLKALDYKSIGNVVCTQPRRTPTEKGADTVSTQLGLPIYEKKHQNIDDIEAEYEIATRGFSDNYNVQMQHQERKHIKEIYGLILKFITDGSLVQEFRDVLPHFKRMNYDKTTITNHNLYDVIIIDESHEHNKNMDILLTLMRLYVYYNPSIRLVILSATLEEDEPIYRRYYRCINDNYKYPFSIHLQEKKIDRINIDRRYDISPPSGGTRFTVLEHYKPNYDISVLIKELIKTNKGDILVFQPGENDINMLIEDLNSSMDENWIALPFYSSLNDEKRKFIENIDEEFLSLRIDDRQDNFKDIPSLKSGKKSFTNFVLVATNIAEASITIRRLYYVVDTGTRKINTYDYKRRSEKLIITDISETSRVQRKGRVGRSREGEAYFMYEYGRTSKNKIPYDFSIANVSTDIYTRLKNNTNEKEFIIKQYKFYDIIKLNYETTDGEYKYIGNPEYNDYTFKYYIPIYYETGYAYDDLYDKNGLFYLIHPEELNIERNINGTIVKVKNSKEIKIIDYKTGKIQSDKMDSFFLDFKINNYIDDNNDKTEEGINMTEIIEKFKLKNTKNSKCLIYSILTGSYDKMLLAISILESCNNDIMKFAKRDENGNIIINKIKYHSNYSNHNSDLEIIIAQMYDLLKSIKYDELFNLENYVDKSLVIQNKKINVLDILKILKSHEDNEDYDRELIIQEVLYSMKTKLFNEYDKYRNICDTFEINVDIFLNKKTINTIIDNFIKINDIKKNLYFKDKRNKSYEEFLNKYTNIYNDRYNNYDSFKLSFLLSNPYNIALNIEGSTSYLLTYYPYATNIYNIDKTKTIINNKKEYIYTTYMNINNIKDYIFFNEINPDKDTISNYIKLDKSYIDLFRYIYNKDRLKQIVETYENKIDKYITKLNTARQYKAPLPLDYNIIIKFKQTFIKLLNDIK
jgi:hypothetical protein